MPPLLHPTAALAALLVAGAGAAQLNALWSSTGESYNITLDGELWLVGQPVAVHRQGQWFVAPGNLSLVRFQPIAGADALGAFQGKP
jgi:hypothetical protein